MLTKSFMMNPYDYKKVKISLLYYVRCQKLAKI